MMYRDIVKIYIGDLNTLEDTKFWNEIKNRLLYANQKYNIYDDFYINIIKSEMCDFGYFTSISDDYIVYMEEICDSCNENEPQLLFTKEDLEDYTSNDLELKHTYIER